MANTKFETQEVRNQNTRFLSGKGPYTPWNQGKSKQVPNSPKDANSPSNKRQTEPKTPTPPEEENSKFHQVSLGKPQDKLRPLEQQGKSNPFQTRAWAILESA
jgi:hypothetical protein